jgi:hypothetical protein
LRHTCIASIRPSPTTLTHHATYILRATIRASLAICGSRSHHRSRTMEFPQLKAWLRLPVRLNIPIFISSIFYHFAKHVKRTKDRTVRTQQYLPTTNSFLIQRSSPDIVHRVVSIYDIKFYPYTAPGEDPVFAAVAGREVSHIRSLVNKRFCDQF